MFDILYFFFLFFVVMSIIGGFVMYLSVMVFIGYDTYFIVFKMVVT